MCGLCLPHCPTYLKTKNEAESPRGRISLILGLAKGQLEPSNKLRQHLDTCLLCRACEAKCPSGVKFGELMDGARTALGTTDKPTHPQLSLDKLATNKQYRHKEAKRLWLAEASGLRTLGRGLGITKALGLARMEQLAPKINKPHDWQEYYPATSEKQGDVALFIGCFTDMFDQQTLDAAITLLNHCGYGVHVPAAQTCCGALHQHKGDRAKSTALAQQNIAAFEGLNIAAIISTASGCGSHLSEYHQTINKEQTISQKITDISAFLSQIEWPENSQLQPLNQRVAVHDPCSLRNVIKQADAPYKLLQKIPGLDLIALPGNERCCGAAGSYMIEHPEMADQLRDDKIEALKKERPDILVTSNIGCNMHLLAGIRQAKLKIKITHPITLLAQQLT